MTRAEIGLAALAIAVVAFFFAVAPDHRTDYGREMAERYKRD